MGVSILVISILRRFCMKHADYSSHKGSFPKIRRYSSETAPCNELPCCSESVLDVLYISAVYLLALFSKVFRMSLHFNHKLA
ncbi:hypothetical protein, partial [Shewanella algae]|uniref:hypothetical protein n=1 Tax=Shewanella algae TaxID=38313 RepID=UPI001F3B11BA